MNTGKICIPYADRYSSITQMKRRLSFQRARMKRYIKADIKVGDIRRDIRRVEKLIATKSKK